MNLRVALMVPVLLWPLAAGAQELDRGLQAARRGDAAEAVRVLTPLAEQGNIAAQYALGMVHANGDGLPADYAAAAQWFGAAARGGHVEARRHLVFMQQVGLVPVTGPLPGQDSVFRVQVASVSSELDAPREWRRLQRRHPEALGTLEITVIAFDAPDGARSYRVQGGPLDEEGARAVCARLRAEGTTCLTVRP